MISSRSSILFSTTVLFILSFLSWSGLAIQYDTPTTISNPLSVSDVLILNNTSIKFQTTDITIAPSVSLVIIGQCSIVSDVPLTLKFYSLNTTSSSLSSLSLDNFGLIFTNESSVEELTFDMKTRSVIKFLKDTTITYNRVPSNTVIFNGGDVYISNTTTLRLSSSSVPTFNITSTLHNQYRFISTPILRLYPSRVISSLGSLFFFNEIYSLNTAAEDMEINDSLVYFKRINLAGGRLLLNRSTWSMQTQPSSITSYVENTRVVLGVNVTLNYYRNSTEYPQGLIHLTTGGYVDVQSPSTLTILFNLNLQLYLLTTTQSQLIFSENGGINCNGAANSRLHGNRISNAPIVAIQPLNNLVNLGSIDAILVCSAQGVSSRIFNKIGDGFYTSPPCPNGQIRCIGGAVGNTCYNVTDNPCSTACFTTGPNTAIPINFASETFEYKKSSAQQLQSGQRQLMSDSLTAPKTNFTCWNGECVPEASLCPPFVACPPSLPKRCPGYCVEANAECASCNSTHSFACETGCSNIDICGPYDGCALNETMCPNMACVKDPKDCQKYVINNDPNQVLELSYKFIPSTSDLYPKGSSYIPLWTRNITDDANIDTSTHVVIGNNSIDSNQVTSSVIPYADSLARNISGAAIGGENFDYYKHVLSGVFNIKIDGRQQSQFNNGTVNIIFGNLRNNVNASDLCLAFINDDGAWECTEFPVVQLDNGGVLAQTNHFTSFALLLKTQKDSSDNSDGISQKKMIIIVSVVVGGIIIGAIAVGMFIRFKLKHRSFRRWSVHRSDPNMSNNHRFRLKSFGEQSMEKLGNSA